MFVGHFSLRIQGPHWNQIRIHSTAVKTRRFASFILNVVFFCFIRFFSFQAESAIETYERILRIVPEHKEALDSILFLRGRPKAKYN